MSFWLFKALLARRSATAPRPERPYLSLPRNGG